MKKLFILTFILNILFNLIGWYFLPDQVAIHFGSNGKPNSWASSNSNLILFIVLDLFIFSMIYFIPHFVSIARGSLLNIPNKKYWLQPENRGELRVIMERTMYEFGVAMMLFFLAISILATEANLNSPVRLNESAFLTALIFFLVYTVYWCFGLYRSLRVTEKT